MRSIFPRMGDWSGPYWWLWHDRCSRWSIIKICPSMKTISLFKGKVAAFTWRLQNINYSLRCSTIPVTSAPEIFCWHLHGISPCRFRHGRSMCISQNYGRNKCFTLLIFVSFFPNGEEFLRFSDAHPWHLQSNTPSNPRQQRNRETVSFQFVHISSYIYYLNVQFASIFGVFLLRVTIL